MPTESVFIRGYDPADGAAFLEAALESVPEVSPWLPWCHAGYSRANADDWVASQALLFAEGVRYEFAIVDGRGRFLGGCGINQIDPEHRRANVGYWVRTSAAQKGVATAAVTQVARFAFAETDLVRLEILCAVDNRASQRVAEKAGAVREGVLRERLLVHGVHQDAVIYAILKSGWTPP